MGALVTELKDEHRKIAEALAEVQEKGIGSKEGQAKLLSAKEGLLSHLKKEDERLYPPLKKAAEKDERLKGLLEMFAKDMQDVSKGAMDFFGKYAKGGSGLEFAKDFGHLSAVLTSRIRKEETILYPEFDKLNA